ncbi:aromatase/cyclase [Saccharopolyspora sp. NPDC047091]|uniref:aromatase/cyclase n=1 Tax=Saccharopolyspora sp. NPDC047091 TaxID=3155924 RepID=UPI0033E4E6CB
MRPKNVHDTEHTRIVDAPPRVLYELLADVTAWPALFGPSVHVRHLERSERSERFEIWALVNEKVASWTSRRELDPDELRIAFAQERSSAPVRTMSGEWSLRELPGGRTEVSLRHTFTAVDDSPEAVRTITAALRRNSPRELSDLARVAELGLPVGDVVLSFTDDVELPVPVDRAYEFIARADRWAELLPHVRSVRLGEDEPGIQDLRMATETGDGARHETRSVRVCEPAEWIAYKQLRPPMMLTGHSGLWSFEPVAAGTLLTSRHTIVLGPAAVVDGSSAAETGRRVRDALRRNSRTTMAAIAERP